MKKMLVEKSETTFIKHEQRVVVRRGSFLSSRFDTLARIVSIYTRAR